MDKQKRQDIIIRICCLIAALALWMYIRASLDPVLTSTVKYVPVEILNEDTLDDRNLVLIPGQDFSINLTVKATNALIAGIDKNKDFKLVVDLQGYALTPGENKVQVTVKESPTGVQVVNAEGLLMKMDVDNLVSKELPVESQVSGNVEEGYYNDDNILSIKTGEVSGPERYVSKVTRLVADIDIDNATEDIVKSYKIKAVDENGKEITGVDVSPEYVQVTSDIKKGKMVPVNVVTTGTSPSGVTVASIESNPKSIEISGDSEVIDQISSINTENINLSAITDSTNKEVQLVLPEGVNIVGDNKGVSVKIVVKRVAEKKLTLSVANTNLGEGLSISSGPGAVEVIISGDSSKLDGISEDTLKANVDLSGLTEGSHSVNVNITGLPDGIELKKCNPQEVTVELKSTKEEKKTDGN